MRVALTLARIARDEVNPRRSLRLTQFIELAAAISLNVRFRKQTLSAII